MPELPEVETIRRGLEESLLGEEVSSVQIFLPKAFTGPVEGIVGTMIESVSRRGKLLIIQTSGLFTLLVHLKMTGQLLLKARGVPAEPIKSTRVIVGLASGSALFFNDSRTFGYIRLYETAQLSEHPFISALGPEPLSEDFSLDYFNRVLDISFRLSLKTFLLDQRKIAGIGNIYADEIAFNAHILPMRLISSLTSGERQLLYATIISVLSRGVALRGSSRTSYLDLYGGKGTFLDTANVYNREGQPCIVCGTIISKIRHAGRGTHYCRICQK